MSSLPVHWSHLHGDIRAQQYHLKQRGRHLWAQRAAHHAGSAFHVQLVLPYAEVILLTQVRESCAARPLGVEAGESATASPAQPDRPRNTGDPWETERPGCDSYSCPCTPGTPQTRPSLPVFLVSATWKRRGHTHYGSPPTHAYLGSQGSPGPPGPPAPTHLWSSSSRSCANSSSTSLLLPNASHRVSWGSN